MVSKSQQIETSHAIPPEPGRHPVGVSHENLARTGVPSGGPGALTVLSTALSPSRPYYLGTGILSNLPAYLRSSDPDHVFLIADEQVQTMHGGRLLRSLQDHRLQASYIACPRGEAAKTVACLERLCEQLLAAGATKDSLLLAMGGGATGNLVGMAAALLFRGIGFVQVPTTLLAQTDSVLSNKQAVNSSAGKNLLGLYHAPVFIWTDSRLVLTEEPLRIRSALVESFKNAFIADPGFLTDLETLLPSVLAHDPAATHEAVLHSVLSKIDILQRDPTERRYAMCLEYGHTFGHALERLAGGTLTHGQAVAIGMMLAARLSHRLGLLDAAAVDLHHYYLHDRLELAVELPPAFSPETVMAMIHNDNKRSRHGIRFVLLSAVGKPVHEESDCLCEVEEPLIMEVLRQSQTRAAALSNAAAC